MTDIGSAEVATTDELAEAILSRIAMYDHVSFAELAQAWPEHFRTKQPDGEMLTLCSDTHPNIIFWAGLSEMGLDAMRIIHPDVTRVPAHLLVYMADGHMLNLPLAKQARQYKKPHWVPVTLRLKKPDPERKKRAHDKVIAALQRGGAA